MSSPHDHQDEHDLGLQHDMTVLLGRRRLLGLLAGAGVVALAGCAAGGPPAGGPPGGAVAAGAEGEIPQETAGPYPGDGSNGPNVLTQSGIVRSDITLQLRCLDGHRRRDPAADRAHPHRHRGSARCRAPRSTCGTATGTAATRSTTCEDQNYLRGVQEADAAGKVSFTSIFPACYAGRWPHVHFEAYPNLTAATSSGNAITTSQLALPQDVCERVYATDGYAKSVDNLGDVSLSSDNVFSDGVDSQLATVTGSVPAGLVATLTVPVAA